MFDCSGIIANTPNFFERKRRDTQAEIMPGHNCDKITSNTKVPERNFHKTVLSCRNCKRGLVVFLEAYLLENAPKHLKEDQALFFAGGDQAYQAWFV